MLKSEMPLSRIRGSSGRLIRIARKELVEILRDRRTIITLVLMPLLVYPLLGIVVQKLMLQNTGKSAQVVYRLGFDSQEEAQIFGRLYDRGHQLADQMDQQLRPSERQGLEIDANSPVPKRRFAERLADQISQSLKPGLEVFISDESSLAESIRAGKVDVGIIRSVDSQTGVTQFELLHNPRSKYGYDALQLVGRRLRLAGDEQLKDFIIVHGRENSPPNTFVFVERPVETKMETPSALLTFVPLMLVLMTITGAVYPAIDLTAGERERGTMEILVAAPISRMVLLFGKFVAVLTVAMLTALANLVAMAVTIYSLGLDDTIFGTTGLSLSSLLVMLLLLFVLAAFFSATLLGLTSFARSFKEAQSYLIPLMLVAFAPGLLSLTPNLATTSLLATIPLVNIVMVGRDLLTGDANVVHLAIAIISTTLYGLLALSLAARVFGADSVLTGGSASLSEMFSSTRDWRPYPTMSNAMLLLAVLFPFFVVVSGLVNNAANRWDASIEQRLWVNAAITVGLFVVLPLGLALALRLLPRKTFCLSPPGIGATTAAVLLGVSTWTLVYELEVFTLSLTDNWVEELLERFTELKIGLNSLPLSVKLVCLAIVPAVCEEFTFRGFLLSAFQNRVSAALAIVVTAVLFGLFHVFIQDMLLFERMVPSTLMGLLLGFVCVRTGSIFPGMLLHVIHNGLMLTLGHYEQSLKDHGIGLAAQQHLPPSWILIALVPLAAGIVLLLASNRKPNTNRFE